MYWTFPCSTVKIRLVAKGENPVLGSALILSRADMLLWFACGDTKSLKTWVHEKLVFNIAANSKLICRVSRGEPCMCHTFSLGITCKMTAFQAFSSSLVPCLHSQAVIGSCSQNSRLHNHHASLKHRQGPHARAQEQPSGKVTNTVAPTEKDKLVESYSSLFASSRGEAKWQQTWHVSVNRNSSASVPSFRAIMPAIS